jgi:hypothetical protein
MKVSRWVIVITWIFAIMLGLGAFFNWLDDLTGNWSALMAASAVGIIGLVKKNPPAVMVMLLIAISDETGALIRGSELGSRWGSLVYGVLMGLTLSFWVKNYSWAFLFGEKKTNEEKQ